MIEETRLLLRGRDLDVLARKPTLEHHDLRMIVEFSRDITHDADVLLSRGRVLPPTVEPVIGLLRSVVQLAAEAGRLNGR